MTQTGEVRKNFGKSANFCGGLGFANATTVCRQEARELLPLRNALLADLTVSRGRAGRQAEGYAGLSMDWTIYHAVNVFARHHKTLAHATFGFETVGVVVYAALVVVPWLATRPGEERRWKFAALCGGVCALGAAHQSGDRGLKGAIIHVASHAAARWYSWMNPPSRSRRRISPTGRSCH